MIDYSRLSVADLSAQVRITVEQYMLSVLCGDDVTRDAHGLCVALHGLAGAVIERGKKSFDLHELSLLSPALFNITRTGIGEYIEERRLLDTRLVMGVMTTPDVEYRVLHSALMMLMQEPLTHIEFDSSAPGKRRYIFTLGKELYESTLRSWVDTQHPDGSWTGVTPEEASSRREVLRADFGSIA